MLLIQQQREAPTAVTITPATTPPRTPPAPLTAPIYPACSSTLECFNAWKFGYEVNGAKPIKNLTLQERNIDARMKNLYSKRRKIAYWIVQQPGANVAEKIEALHNANNMQTFNMAQLEKLPPVPRNIDFP